MPSIQRRRHGQAFKVWPEVVVEDRRGNSKRTVDLSALPHGHDGKLKGNFTPDRGSRAEVPGQQEIDVYRVVFETGLEDVTLWSRLLWAPPGREPKYWDIVEPPVYRHGTRHTRHWTMVIRKRPEKVVEEA